MAVRDVLGPTVCCCWNVSCQYWTERESGGGGSRREGRVEKGEGQTNTWTDGQTQRNIKEQREGGRGADRQAIRQTDRQTELLVNGPETEIDRQIGRQVGRQTET